MPKAMIPARQKTIDEELAKNIASVFQQLSMVEDKGFRSYTRALNPVYCYTGRKQNVSQTIIPRLYDKEHASGVKDTEPPLRSCLLHVTHCKL